MVPLLILWILLIVICCDGGGPNSYLISNSAGVISATGAFSGDGGQATAAKFKDLYDVWMDSLGVSYLADNSNNRIRKIDTSNIVTTIVGAGAATSTGDGFAATSGTTNSPTGVWGTSSGKLYIMELAGNYVRMVTNGIITTIAGNGNASPSSTGVNGDGKPATSGSFSGPYFLYGDSAGNIYIPDMGNNRVRRVFSSNGYLSTFAGTGTSGGGAENIAATSTTFNNPKAVYVNPTTADVYVSDVAAFKVRRIDGTSNIINKIAGTGTSGDGAQGSVASSSAVANVNGIWLDPSGFICFADTPNFRIKLITTGGIVYYIAGTGNTGSSGDNGPALSALMTTPTGMFGLDNGDMLFIDNGVNVMRRLTYLAPTVSPTVVPSAVPSLVPSMAPSVLPSIQPSLGPSVSPTIAPTVVPSVVPSTAPSGAPSMQPSLVPSVIPSIALLLCCCYIVLPWIEW